VSRDDFSRTTKDTLAKRVGFRCSNPNCRRLTSGPKSDASGVINIGVAAHITAAASGGPRHDESLSSDERRALDNGIWLCQTCAKLVDDAPSSYPVELLRNWKDQAEADALSQLESMKAASDAVSSMRLAGVQDLVSHWKALQAIAKYPITPAVFTASREMEVAAVQEWLSGPPSSLFMQTDGLTDGLDFLAAVSANEDQLSLQNALIIHTIEAWCHLAASRDRLVLVAGATLQLHASDTAGAVEAGHYVFVSGPRGASNIQAAKALRRQDHYSVHEALIASGFSDSHAMSLAKASCGSSSILKRLITKHPETVFPAWCQDEVRSSLAPFTLVGGWTHVDFDPPSHEETSPKIGGRPPLDLWAVKELIGCSREDLEDHVNRWRHGTEPLFLRFGSSVLVSSREDTWYLLAGAISPRQLSRFRDLAVFVLEEDNPALELDPDQRWMASLLGKTQSLSEELRRSIVETLALMSTYPTADAPDPNVDFDGTARWVLERVLPPGATWQRWASLGRNLTVVAEAVPDLFLTRVEQDLASHNPELPKLFRDQSGPLFGGGSLHCDLLWSLEGLAWSPEYLTRVAKSLAKLAACESQVPSGNSPGNSLREIFLLWLWHTNASIADRLRALRGVLEAEPEVGWKLLGDLLPGGTTGFSHNTHMPRWRPWAEGWSRAKLQPQKFEYAMAVANLTVDAAGTKPERWSEVLDGLLRFNFNAEITNRVFSGLENVYAAVQPNPEAKFSLWKTLRQMLARHERYSDADWAFSKDTRDRLAVIRDKLQPDDAVLRHHWLFDYRAELSDPDPLEDHVAHDNALNAARLDALREIVSQTRAQGVVCLLDLASDANLVGWLIGQGPMLTPEEMDLPAILDTSDNQRMACIKAYVASRYNREAWEFVNSLQFADWSVQQTATFARCLPFDAEIWRWLRRFGEDVENAYWQDVQPFLRQSNVAEIQTAATCLIHVGRAFAAVDVLHLGLFQKLAPPTDFVADVLEAALSPENSEDPSKMRNVAHGTQKLIQYLQQDEDFDRVRLARIEWGFLPLLDKDFSEVGPDTLVRIIGSKPEFYVDLLKLVYRRENDPPDKDSLTEQEQLMANHANRLLDGLTKLPASDNEGVVDCDYFRNWLQQVRSLADECDRLKSCDLSLGEFIARATQLPDENWPSPELVSLLEEVGTEDLFHGFVLGVLNSRGVTWRDPSEGGRPEHSLADRYRQLAEITRPASPKLAAAFLELARHYEFDAQREDEDAERRRLGR
jgi:hypothetical protein